MQEFEYVQLFEAFIRWYDHEDIEAIAAQWNVVGYEIDYCLASYHPLDNFCSLFYSYRIMIWRPLLSVLTTG